MSDSTDPITEIARDLLQRADSGTWVDIVDKVIAKAKITEPDAWEAFTATSDAKAVRALLSSLSYEERHAEKIRANRSVFGGMSKAHFSVGEGRFARLLKMTRAEVQAQIDHLKATAEGAWNQASILEKVLVAMPNDDNAVVADHWKEEDLDALAT